MQSLTRRGEIRTTDNGGTGLPVLAVSAKALATLLSVSLRTVRQLDCSGWLPRAVTIGARAKRWRASDIDEWLRLGCPDRKTFEAIRGIGNLKG